MVMRRPGEGAGGDCGIGAAGPPINGFGRTAGLWHYLKAMTEPESLILVYLRRIDAKVDALAHRVDELTQRVSAVEVGLAAVRRDLGHLA